jgi:hypothetical protein
LAALISGTPNIVPETRDDCNDLQVQKIKKMTADYTDYTEFFVFSSRPFMLHRVFAAYLHNSYS